MAMVLLKVLLLALLPSGRMPFAAIALAGALPVLLYRPGLGARLRRLDWGTLVFNYGRNENKYFEATLVSLDNFLVSLGYLSCEATVGK